MLLSLNEAGGQLRMRDLADRIMLSRSGLTRLVDRMAAAGLVDRKADPDDGRGTLACVTDDGRAALRRAAPVHLRGIQRHFGQHVSAQDAATLTRVLGPLGVSARPTRPGRR